MITNAALLEVRAAAAADAYGDIPDDAEAGVLKWSGSRSAYLTRKRKFVIETRDRSGVVESQRSTSKEVDVLTIRGTLPIEVTGGPPAKGDTILVTDSRGPMATKRFRVAGVDVRATGSAVDSIRLELASERAT